MSESKIYLETFMNNYYNSYQDISSYTEFLKEYGLINTNKDNYKKINFFIKNCNNLLLLSKNDNNRLWFLENLCNLSSIFSQIQTDNLFPNEGFYMYKNYEFKNGISAPGYLLFFINKISDSEVCKFGEHCNRCNPSHFKDFFHPRTLKIKKPTIKTNRFEPYTKRGGKKKINKSKTKKQKKQKKQKKIF